MDKYLDQLVLSAYLQTDTHEDLAAAKSQLVRSLDRQIQQVEAALNDGAFLDMVQAWLRCEEPSMPLHVDRFYWQHPTGAWFITLQLNGETLAITAQKPSVEVGHCEDIPNALEQLKLVLKAGELDAEIRLLV
jgi:hypothetical protein